MEHVHSLHTKDLKDMSFSVHQQAEVAQSLDLNCYPVTSLLHNLIHSLNLKLCITKVLEPMGNVVQLEGSKERFLYAQTLGGHNAPMRQEVQTITKMYMGVVFNTCTYIKSSFVSKCLQLYHITDLFSLKSSKLVEKKNSLK